jgi:hypothetical protein
MARVSIFLIIVALIGGTMGCTPTPSAQYNLTISSTEGGMVTTPGEGVFTYNEGEKVNLAAIPDEGYRFVNWTGDVGEIADVEDSTTTITMKGNYSITATFAVKQYTLVIHSAEGGSVTTPGESAYSYDKGEAVNLVAVADEGYVFIDWTGDVGTVADINTASTTITMNGGYSVTANFAGAIQDWYDLDAVRNNFDCSHILMNNLDSTTAGYMGLASRTANGGKGWQPIRPYGGISGSFDGQGYEIGDLFINRPSEGGVGLFGWVAVAAVVEDIDIVNATVTGGYAVGSLVGWNHGTVSNSYYSGSVTGYQEVGGLVGRNEWAGHVSSSSSAGSVTGTTHVGGLVGLNCDLSTVSNSFSAGWVTGSEYVGGLVGSNGDSGAVSNCYSIGTVSGDTHVGGLVGASGGIVTGDTVFTTGSSGPSVVTTSYSAGSVTGDESIGGLVGSNDDGGVVSNCYSIGTVTGNTYVGGLVGLNFGTVSNSFWDTETSGRPASAGGTGKTTAEMKSITTFSGAGWSIVAVAGPGARDPAYIWNTVDGQTYPFLSWQL